MNDKKKCRSVNFFNIIATEEHKGSLNQNYFLYWLNIYLSKDFKLPFEIFCYMALRLSLLQDVAQLRSLGFF